jgi:hypothetical protein
MPRSGTEVAVLSLSAAQASIEAGVDEWFQILMMCYGFFVSIYASTIKKNTKHTNQSLPRTCILSFHTKR